MKVMEILLVEDNEADAFLMQEVLQESSYRNNVTVVPNGLDAMEFLRRQGHYGGAPRPDIILLDLNLPKKDGREVLEEVKSDPDLKIIPVVVLTTSESEEDVRNSYGSHANCYITKPMELDQTYRTIQGIQDFWFGTVRLPKGNG
ncbi:response regulator [Geotalea sp. SG265]|uniref:response regulator n=1 Tax=Geotalea sp. SG265 TaxID=2922867 RepID=UPI001FB02A20|nr:response regulator [Geotalea sp. SG265]